MARRKPRPGAQPVLSICMPTYNRAALLAATLRHYERLLSKPQFSGKVEVCVSDNASGDGTWSTLQSFAKRSRFSLSCRKNARNEGFDRNAVSAMRMARGRFVHLVSDEEHYREGVLRDIVGRLERGECDCVFVNQTQFPGMKESEIARLEAEPMLALRHGKLYRIFFCLFSLIVSKKSLDGFLGKYDIRRFYGTLFAFAPIYLHALRECRRLYVLRQWHCEMPSIAYKVHLPHDHARTFDYLFFSMVRECERQGIITHREFGSFKRRILLWHVIRGMLLYRTYIYPAIYPVEGEKTAGYYRKLRDEFGFGRAGRAAFGMLVRAIYTPLVPYHWLYRAHYFIRRTLLGDRGMRDRFEVYDQIFSKKGEKFELGMDRY